MSYNKQQVYCEVCDQYVSYNPETDTLSCGHRPDNDGGYDGESYLEDHGFHIEEYDE